MLFSRSSQAYIYICYHTHICVYVYIYIWTYTHNVKITFLKKFTIHSNFLNCCPCVILKMLPIREPFSREDLRLFIILFFSLFLTSQIMTDTTENSLLFTLLVLFYFNSSLLYADFKLKKKNNYKPTFLFYSPLPQYLIMAY